jgi:hypothetical protein
MIGMRRLRGSVKLENGGAGERGLTVVVTRGGTEIAEGSVSPDGKFELEIPEAADLAVTIIGLARVVRRPLEATRGEWLDLGEVELPFLEFPAGIDGQAWDALDERPVRDGVAELRLRRDLMASRQLESDGWFSFEVMRKRLLTAGAYRVFIKAPGYRSAECVVEVTDDMTSYRLGRIELGRARSL